MFIILKKRHQPGVYVPLRALFLVINAYKASLSAKQYSNIQSMFFSCSVLFLVL